jgi:hypothetical protein
MFLGLPPGPYEMTFQADRFEPVNRSATVLSGAAIEQNVTLTAVGQNGEATFTGTVPSSLAGASIGTTYRKEEIDVLATPRTLHGIAQLAPAIRRIRGRSPLMEASHSTISS